MERKKIGKESEKLFPLIKDAWQIPFLSFWPGKYIFSSSWPGSNIYLGKDLKIYIVRLKNTPLFEIFQKSGRRVGSKWQKGLFEKPFLSFWHSLPDGLRKNLRKVFGNQKSGRRQYRKDFLFCHPGPTNIFFRHPDPTEKMGLGRIWKIYLPVCTP